MNRTGLYCLRYGGAVGFVLLALAANLALASLDHFASALFLAAVAVSAYCCGLGPGLLATALAALALDYFFLQEYYSLDLGHATWVWLTVFIAVSMLINVLQEAQRRLATLLRFQNERKSQFMALLAHELRNFLSPIHSALAIQRLRCQSDEVLTQSCDILERQVRHMSRLIEDLLDVSRINQGKVQLQLQPVDLQLVVSHAVAGVQPLLQNRGHQLDLTLPVGPVPVLGDPTRLEQVLLNLLTNAAKYTGNGGRIWLTVELQGPDILVRVRDNGKGLKPELVPHVFDLFMQGEPGSQGGLGIGLHMVRGLVALHGGSVSAASEGPNQGCEFMVRLPARHAASEEAPVVQYSTNLP